MVAGATSWWCMAAGLLCWSLVVMSMSSRLALGMSTDNVRARRLLKSSSLPVPAGGAAIDSLRLPIRLETDVSEYAFGTQNLLDRNGINSSLSLGRKLLQSGRGMPAPFARITAVARENDTYLQANVSFGVALPGNATSLQLAAPFLQAFATSLPSSLGAYWQSLEVSGIAPYPGYEGSLGVTGSIRLAGLADDKLYIFGYLEGLEPLLTGGIHIHEGYACEASGNGTGVGKWNTTYVADESGFAIVKTSRAATPLLTTVGRTLVVHGNDGERIACGYVAYDSPGVPHQLALDTLEPYHAGNGSTANITIRTNGTDVSLVGTVQGVDSSSSPSVTLAVHSGPSCTELEAPYASPITGEDPWPQQHMYTKSSELVGVAHVELTVSGYPFSSLLGRPLVLGDSEGNPIACALIPGNLPSPLTVTRVTDISAQQLPALEGQPTTAQITASVTISSESESQILALEELLRDRTAPFEVLALDLQYLAGGVATAESGNILSDTVGGMAFDVKSSSEPRAQQSSATAGSAATIPTAAAAPITGGEVLAEQTDSLLPQFLTSAQFSIAGSGSGFLGSGTGSGVSDSLVGEEEVETVTTAISKSVTPPSLEPQDAAAPISEVTSPAEVLSSDQKDTEGAEAAASLGTVAPAAASAAPVYNGGLGEEAEPSSVTYPPCVCPLLFKTTFAFQQPSGPMALESQWLSIFTNYTFKLSAEFGLSITDLSITNMKPIQQVTASDGSTTGISLLSLTLDTTALFGDCSLGSSWANAMVSDENSLNQVFSKGTIALLAQVVVSDVSLVPKNEDKFPPGFCASLTRQAQPILSARSAVSFDSFASSPTPPPGGLPHEIYSSPTAAAMPSNAYDERAQPCVYDFYVVTWHLKVTPSLQSVESDASSSEDIEWPKTLEDHWKYQTLPLVRSIVAEWMDIDPQSSSLLEHDPEQDVDYKFEKLHDFDCDRDGLKKIATFRSYLPMYGTALRFLDWVTANDGGNLTGPLLEHDPALCGAKVKVPAEDRGIEIFCDTPAPTPAPTPGPTPGPTPAPTPGPTPAPTSAPPPPPPPPPPVAQYDC